MPLEQLSFGQYPPRKFHPQIIAPGQFPPVIIDPLNRKNLDTSHLGLFRLGKLSPGDYAVSKCFTVFHFAFVTIRYFLNKNMHFFKTWDWFHFRIISNILGLLSKVLLLYSFWHINKFISTKFQNKKVFSSSE